MNRDIITKDLLKLIYQDFVKLIQLDHISWQEFADIENQKFGLNFTESAFRKRIQMHKQSIEWISMSENQDIRERFLNIKEIRLETLKNKNKNIIKELKSLNTEYLRDNELKDVIDTFISPAVEFNRIIPLKSFTSNVYIIADVQENGSNYCKGILEFVYNKILNDIEKENLQEIWILEQGDGIDNILRIQDLHYNPNGVVMQLNYYQQALAVLLEKISQVVKINFSIINSNHLENRQLSLKAGSLKNEDLTMLILSYLKSYLRNNKNIVWLNNPKKPEDLNYNLIKIQNYNIYLNHGDQKIININNPNVTFDRINRYFNYDIDYMIFAHLHHQSIKSIVQNVKKGGNKSVIFVSALDPRLNKQNESTMMLSSTPGFTKLTFEKDKGLTIIENIPLPKEMWVK